MIYHLYTENDEKVRRSARQGLEWFGFWFGFPAIGVMPFLMVNHQTTQRFSFEYQARVLNSKWSWTKNATFKNLAIQGSKWILRRTSHLDWFDSIRLKRYFWGESVVPRGRMNPSSLHHPEVEVMFHSNRMNRTGSFISPCSDWFVKNGTTRGAVLFATPKHQTKKFFLSNHCFATKANHRTTTRLFSSFSIVTFSQQWCVSWEIELGGGYWFRHSFPLQM